MTTGEKIKYFRNMRGISQDTLGQLSGINSATIKKYEYGIRNPKPDQLLKIANALGISINIFMDFDIETVSDVLSLLFKLDDQIDMKFEADKMMRAISSLQLLSSHLRTISSTRNFVPI